MRIKCKLISLAQRKTWNPFLAWKRMQERFGTQCLIHPHVYMGGCVNGVRVAENR